jgi:uncharacterized protein (UPF0335 family)
MNTSNGDVPNPLGLSEETLLRIDGWIACRDGVGASSMAIANHLRGLPCDGSYPSDSGDFGRCEGLIAAAPELWRHLHVMADLNAYWQALWPQWDAISALPEIARTAKIRAVLRPIQKIDPSHVDLGDGVSLSSGKVTFKGDGGAGDAPQDDLVSAIGQAARAGRLPMKEDPDFKKHNQDSYNVAADELRSFIERVEQLDAEKRDLAEQQKEVMAEAKGRGYDTKVMRKVIALRKRKPDEIAEEEAIFDLYKSALGMA